MPPSFGKRDDAVALHCLRSLQAVYHYAVRHNDCREGQLLRCVCFTCFFCLLYQQLRNTGLTFCKSTTFTICFQYDSHMHMTSTLIPRYFGEQPSAPCERCDVCVAGGSCGSAIPPDVISAAANTFVEAVKLVAAAGENPR